MRRATRHETSLGEISTNQDWTMDSGRRKAYTELAGPQGDDAQDGTGGVSGGGVFEKDVGRFFDEAQLLA